VRRAPCMYRTSTQTTGPKMKFCSRVGMRVNGMQTTASSRSATLRFINSTFVRVLIRRFCAIVRATREFPDTDSTKMATYSAMRSSTCIPVPLPVPGKDRFLTDALSNVEFTMSASTILQREFTGRYSAVKLLSVEHQGDSTHCCAVIRFRVRHS